MPVLTRPRPVRAAATVAGLGTLLLCAGIVTAVPAAAVDDPARPDARVTHGPSCRPGGVVVEVTAGTTAYAVRLVTAREPRGEDAAELAPGEMVVLRTGDVAWGETIDPDLQYAALDGSGARYVDELEGFSFTRPAQVDCAAITPPTAAASVPPSVVVPAQEVVPLPVPGLPAPNASVPVDAAAGAPPLVVAAPTEPVVAGAEVVLEARGFDPGEEVVVRGPGGAVLTSATAGRDGSVEVPVLVPDGAAGKVTFELLGRNSAGTAEIGLQVVAPAGSLSPVAAGSSWPPLSAAVALLVAGTGVVVAAGRRGAASRGRAAPGSA